MYFTIDRLMRGRQSTRAAGDKVVDAELFAMIYEAAAIPELWPQTLDRLASSVDAYGAALVSIDRNSALRFASTETYRPAYTRYHELGGFTIANPRAERAIAGRRFEFLPDIDLCSLEELRDDKLYEIVLRPFGIGWTIGSPLPSPSHGRAADLSLHVGDLIPTSIACPSPLPNLTVSSRPGRCPMPRD
jgi:hypothetical protein